MRHGSLIRALLSRVFGIVVFLIIVLIINILARFIGSNILSSAAGFLNDNVWFLILIAIVFFIADWFRFSGFPLNLPGPLFSAIGWFLIVWFIRETVLFLYGIAGINILKGIMVWILGILSIAVPLAVLLMGYVRIMQRAGKKKGRKRR